MNLMNPKYTAVLLRAGRMFVIGAVSTMSTVSAIITVGNIQSWHSLATALNVVILSLLIGGINGVLAGADKLIRWEE